MIDLRSELEDRIRAMNEDAYIYNGTDSLQKYQGKTFNGIPIKGRVITRYKERISQQSVTCPRCGMTSYHPDDILFKYCGNCHEFHEFMEK